MKKAVFKTILLSSFAIGALTSCGGSSSKERPSTSPTTSSADTSEHVFSQPVFSQSSYSYDKNIGCDLEMPVELNGVNIYTVYFNDYLLNAKQFEYNEITKTLNIKESFMVGITKGQYELKVIFDDEVEPCLLIINVMNSINTSFDTTAKLYEFGRSGDLNYECDFSTASVKSLLKDGNVIPSSYYEYENGNFTLKSELLDHCFGSPTFELVLTNNDVYSFVVNTDIMFFTDYDITTIHSDVESVYGSNPLYQYASSEHVSIVDASEYGMSGRALKYVPNYEDVELNCHGIMTLANNETSMTWYKVGYTKGASYLISFDYQTIGTSDALGQTFQFASVTDWGVPFNYSKDLLMGPSNDNVVHHFSIVLTGEQIQSGTLIFAKWLGGSGYLLLDNMRVSKINYPFVVDELSSFKSGSSDDYIASLNSNGWLYSVNIDDVAEPNVICEPNRAIIPASLLNKLSYGEHKITFVTPVGNYDKILNVISNGIASLTETSKNFVNSAIGLKLAGSFSNVTLTKALKYGSSSFDTSRTSGASLDVNDFIIANDGLTIGTNILQYLYGSTMLKLFFSNGETVNVTLNNTKQIFYSNFNETDVWCHDFDGTSTNCLLCQDTSMVSFNVEDGRKHLVYQPKNATLGHSSTPGTFQNGFFTFRRNDSSTLGTNWETLNYSTTKSYKITLNYKIIGDNANTDLILYRWVREAIDDKTTVIDPNQTSWSIVINGNDLAGFYFYCSFKNSSDVSEYKVSVYSLIVEEC